MYRSEDFEKLCFLYKLEGQPRNVLLESFYQQQGIFYPVFYKWFASCKKAIVSVEVVSMSQNIVRKDNPTEEISPKNHLLSKESIESVVISLSNGVQV